MGGLLDLAFSASKDAEAEKAIVPIRAALNGDDTAVRFGRAVEIKAKGMPCQALLPVQLTALVGSSQLDPKLRSNNGNAVLLINVVYSMTADSRYLTANAVVLLLDEKERVSVDSGDAAALLRRAAYANRFVYTKKLEDFGSSAALGKVWTAKEGERLKAGLDELADGIASLAVSDVSAIQSVPAAGANAERFELTVADRQVEVSREADGSLVVITN